jgi:hypothetical protein
LIRLLGGSHRLAGAIDIAEMMAPVTAEARLARFLLCLSAWMTEAT